MLLRHTKKEQKKSFSVNIDEILQMSDSLLNEMSFKTDTICFHLNAITKQIQCAQTIRLQIYYIPNRGSHFPISQESERFPSDQTWSAYMVPVHGWK